MIINKNMYALGTIGRSYGVRGQFKFKSFIEYKRRLLTLKKIYIGPDDKTVKQYEVYDVRLTRDGIIIKLREINDRESAKALNGQYLFVTEEDVVKPPEGHYYIHDIIGCAVTFGRKKLGKVIDVHRKHEGFAQDIWVIEGKPEIWIPVLPHYIKKVDIKKKKIAVQDVEGFLE
ncbi:MAG: ribosome maturation factor RimM [Bacteroidetes bacterium]|nr:ribosome maturation factor RimM [Bacteroidota bacterium]MBU1423166.1 ribosome maturation factor RimM [Bacteroidota bacterium]MBU2635629.1 ribosome maturation factor RimM [Bacteroidota bacterium]